MIELKKLELDDLSYRVDLLNNNVISPHINTSEKFTLSKTQKWFSVNENNSSRIDFVFISNSNNVGMGGITDISIHNKNCELYMYMDPGYHGLGLGYLACKSMCEYVFDVLKLDKVYLYTFSDNNAANKLYEKVGFKLEGNLRKHTFKDHELKDRNIYGLLKEEFK